MRQLGLGDVWDAGDLIVCSCTARGPVYVLDRKIDVGLIERRAVCKGCGAETVVAMSAPAPKPPRREAPLLWMMGDVR